MARLPTGTVTFLFTDVEGSTRLLQELGDRYAEALADHRRALRDAFARHGGAEVDTQGDAFFVAFAKASDALAAAAEGQNALESGPIRVRMGLHTGEPLLAEEGYVGIDVHRAARIAAAGHGGQILVSRSTRDLGGADSLRDLGEHRLKDLSAPERIYQLGDGEFPPLKSLNQTNLPVQPTPFIGRERELGELLDLLDDHRLVTLTGAGGSGKTRLALQTAAQLVDEHPDGVWFVSLAAVNDPDLIEPTIMQVLGAREDLRQHLRGKRLLLLLDNLEQLLPGVAPVVAGLGTKVLATSRERLNVLGEQEYPVPTLPPPEAVALFTERARELKPAFQPDVSVNEIAGRLDGLPLALELAAARVKVLTPAQILERLGHSLDLLTTGARDAPERQRTLRATIEWSYDLLNEAEQQLFVRLAVFRGSFELDAAERIIDADVDTLGSLVDKSLLRQTEAGRFFMLETIREFVAELFTEVEESPRIARAHADHYLDLAERTQQRTLAGDGVDAYATFDADHDNFRAALAVFVSDGAVEQEFRLLKAIAGYWLVRGHLVEGNRHVESALRRRDAAPPVLLARVLAEASDLARIVVGPERAASYAEQSLEVARKTGDSALVQRALHELGESVQSLGDLARAKELYHEAIAVGRAAGRSGAGSLGNLGDLALVEGDFQQAVALSAEAEELFRAEGTTLGTVVARFNRASALIHLGRADDARPLLNEALREAYEVGHSELTALCLLAAAALLATEGSCDDAARLLGCAEAIMDEVGSRFGAADRRLREAAMAKLDEERAAAPLHEGRQMSRDDAVALARQYLD